MDQFTALGRKATADLIRAKLEVYLAKRADLARQRADILTETRKNDRDIADLKAAARVFELDIEFPAEDPRDDYTRMQMHRRELEIREQVQAIERSYAKGPPPSHVVSANTITLVPSITQVHSPAAAPVPQKNKRPALRSILLEQLKSMGANGAKAAQLREYFERTYGEVIHEKTVGMTLYRLSLEGLVRRDGHNWFFGAPTTTGETKNPAGETAGPGNLFD